ncbi:MAG: hypothetical protein AAF705_16685 [Bacteroidota bacterium]
MEGHKASLKRAIAALPEYEAPPFIWDSIDAELENDHKDRLIQASIPELEIYKAPTSVWEGIESKLNAPKERKLNVVMNWRRLGGIAAGLLIILSIGFGFWPKQMESATYASSVEPVDQYLLEADWDTDEATFAQVVKMHDEYTNTFNDLESLGLKAELQELNEARKELKTAIELYGNDHELIRQLAALERDRTQVIKQMAFKI